ncbi:glycosyltransferase [Calothrix sp. 336/3]|uniref:glycosyltransferase n=1 Tax=Calothrix sp. 336/3 TaxID=1337936 RepID=UPI0004E375CC|nr:glycosyltransferase [Calothrix sp. 336/3]AKG20400.1 hypothetical protein IJ00_02850 [Calothrix sp. 336/3]
MKIDILYFDAGSGHRSAAMGLKSALLQERNDWQVRAVNIVDIFDVHPRCSRTVRRGIDHFNGQLQREKVFDLKGLINLSLLFHDLLSVRDIKQISQFWAESPVDAVVSVTPIYNPVLYRSVRLIKPETICVTIPVDFAEVKPRYWFTPKVEQYYLNGTEMLWQQAKKAKIADEFNHRISGMIIEPECYENSPINIYDEITKLGLDPTLPTGLVSFGGQGSILLSQIAHELVKSPVPVNMIFLCGRNQAVFEELNNLPTPYNKLVLSYLKETPIKYLQLADFAIGKPGAMTITESMIVGVPLIMLKSRGLRPVQRDNEAWVIEHGVGKIVDRPKNVPAAIVTVLNSPTYRQNAQNQYHRGVFEAAKILRSLVEGKSHK